VTIGDLATLRNQPGVFGPVASTATAWRVLDTIEESLLDQVKLARLLGNGRGCCAAKPAGRFPRCGVPAWWCRAW
jgi:hydroxyethylthiazole kinase-like sugar kinase family protein